MKSDEMNVLVETLARGVGELNLEITGGQLKKFEKYYCMLVETNKRLNLTSVVDEREVALKHFVDSLTCLKAVSFEDGISLLDIGTGAGFPGLPLKICRPEIWVTLVESLEKRVSFLRKVILELGLEKVTVLHVRAEELGHDKNHREKYDRVVARAVAELAVLAEYCMPAVKVGGYFLAMKGPKVDEEIEGARRAMEILGGEIKKNINFKLPLMGDERNMVLIKKIRCTPEKYPRRMGVPLKKPLKLRKDLF